MKQSLLNVAVCGGASELGLKIAERLHEIGGFRTTSYDLRYPMRPAHDSAQIFDLTNDYAFYGSFQWYKYDACFQAARPPRDETLSDMIVKTLKINMNVLEACKQFGVKKIATVLDINSDMAATIERLYAAYGKDAGIQQYALWSTIPGEPTIADILIKELNLLDGATTTS